MEFRDLRRQYQYNKQNIDYAIWKVLDTSHFIQGKQVTELEEKLADYVNVKHCVTCANGTDALQLALMTWNIGEGDAVFVPDFTFFSSGEVVSAVGASPIFVDVDIDTYNIDSEKLETAIKTVLQKGAMIPKAIIAVDLFGLPANYPELRHIADQYGLYLLEDAAQGFGGALGGRKACSFGDISTTSFFPAKPLGCYGDGGAIFTDNDEWAMLIRSLAVHGKGLSKYDNVRIGMNSRLDTLQAAILLEKFSVFIEKELRESNKLADFYTEQLKDIVKTPVVKSGFYSSWAQYTIQLEDSQVRQNVQEILKAQEIPTAVYYPKPLHMQQAFRKYEYLDNQYEVTNGLCSKVLSLPFHPYMEIEEILAVTRTIKKILV